jgi:hypothetical protein
MFECCRLNECNEESQQVTERSTRYEQAVPFANIGDDCGFGVKPLGKEQRLKFKKLS